ncbi:hypothetical protein [Halorubrum sp. PV6]|uniref:hypothetical protein n=1 Tax=Halorubrum sp. PV6 TaxID=634157 RepID=UPI000F8F0C0B|nr:hypothetical protein [Halorubrum sp. PV6]
MTSTVTPSGLDGDDLIKHLQIGLDTKHELRREADESGSVVLDLSSANWFAPTFLTPVSVVYNQLVAEGYDITVRYPDSYQVKRYLKMIDFPEGTPDPPDRYRNTLPLCSMNTSRDADAVDIVSEKMGQLLKDQFLSDSDIDQVMWLKYPFSETIDNVDTHSKCDFGALLIQNYPSKNFFDFCIADDGISIPGNFEEHNITFPSDDEANRMAMEDGYSTRQTDDGRRGFGLRTTVEMVCDGLMGEVLISSRDSTLSRYRNNKITREIKSRSWSGTIFAARLHPPSDDFSYIEYLMPD